MTVDVYYTSFHCNVIPFYIYTVLTIASRTDSGQLVNMGSTTGYEHSTHPVALTSGF